MRGCHAEGATGSRTAPQEGHCRWGAARSGSEAAAATPCSKSVMRPEAAQSAAAADTHQHVHLENNVLFPKIVELEARLG